ncbi:caspase-1-like isoform X1 [Papio anubis]|uniref:Caspase-1 n=2 Tax=Papio anubis TaxID=9555 RepID=A0A8I5NAF8_PAPAN|nr:caspase-1-like isoform X1 [Papio anubis]XP_021782184.2 caspase-1-like isoform X1 [Papio anubis]
MADKVLKEKRKLLIRSMGEGTINGLLDELLETRVLNQEEMEKVKRENATVMDKARALLDSVIRKGAPACHICITYICEEDSHLAGTLGLSAGPTSGNHLTTQDSQVVLPSFLAPQAVRVCDNPAMPTSSGSGGSIKLCSLDEAKTIWKEKSTEIYPIMDKSSRTRLALIICNEEFDSLSKRTGAEVDIIGMTTLLQNLGYKVDVKKNLTASEMTTELEAFAHRQEHETSDSTFLVFMSHGIREGICGKKYSEQVPDVLQLNAIFEMLNTRNCPNLKDKPKVIIIQACRGENHGVVWLKDSAGVCRNVSLPTTEELEVDAIKKAHIEKDFIAFCSSTPDNVSWRHPTMGSVFIMRLIEHLQEYAHSCDVEEIFRKVRLSFEQPDDKAQMPSTERVTLTRRFYLFPGH